MRRKYTKGPTATRTVRVREIADLIQYGHTASAVSRQAGPRFLRITDIQNGAVDWDSVPSCDIAEEEIPKYRLSEDDLVFARTGGTTGKSYLIRNCPNAVFASYLIRVRASKNVDPRYLAFFFQSPAYWRQIERGKRGIGQPNVNAKVLGEIEFPLRPLDEQERIVAEIENQFTRLDAGVASLKRVQTALKRYRASVLKAACEGRLVPTEVELARNESRRYETGEQLLQRILKERRKKWNDKRKYKEPRPPQPLSANELPGGWTWASWDQVGFSQNGRPFKSAEYQPSGFKLIRPGNLHISGKVVWTNENTRYVPQRRVEENRDLIVRGRELVMNLTAQSLRDEFLGRICLTSTGEECLLNQRLARLTPTIISPEFALYVLKSSRFRRFVDMLNTGSLIQHMFTSQLAEFTFPLPPLAEQERIIAEVARRLTWVEAMESVIQANTKRAARVRQSILTSVFTHPAETDDQR